MNPVPAVSWLISVKNGMPYLRDTLAAIAAQSFRDAEVLVLDVGSDDGTREELARWFPGRLPGRVFHRGPLGLGAARAELVSYARGEFCACIDADDLCTSDRLEKQVAFLRSRPDVALVGCQLAVIDHQGQPTGVTCSYPLHHDDIVHGFLRGNTIGHSGVLFRRPAVLEVGNYDANASIEDYDLWLRLATRHRLANHADCLGSYRLHPASNSSRVTHAEVAARAEQTLANHAARLYGLSGATLQALREKRRHESLRRAIGISRHLARTQGGTTWRCLRTLSLVEGLRSFTRDDDLLGHLTFALLDPRPGSFRTQWRASRGRLVESLPLGRRIAEAWRHHRAT